MNCQEFELNVIQLARNQSVHASTHFLGLAHAESCARCAARLAEERALLAAVHAVNAEIANDKAPARVEAALLAAFHAQTTAKATPILRLRPQQTKLWPRWKLAVSAAGILLLLSALVTFWQSANSRQPQHEKQAVLPASDLITGPQSAPPKQAGPSEEHVVAKQPEKPRQRLPRHAPATEAPATETEEVEVVTRFFALREGEDLADLESMRLVRVELPGSSLGEVGLPVAPDAANTPVKADVMLGDDGLARAIRFVR